MAEFDSRKVPRVLTLKTGKIISDGLATPIDTAVLNLAQVGACLLVLDVTQVPQHFQLILDPDGERRACEVRWREGHRIGVEFMQADCALTSTGAQQDGTSHQTETDWKIGQVTSENEDAIPCRPPTL